MVASPVPLRQESARAEHPARDSGGVENLSAGSASPPGASERPAPSGASASPASGSRIRGGPTQLAGLHAVVTGASRGIGAVIAAALVADGVRVSLLGRDGDSLQRVAQELGGADRAWPLITDVTDSTSVER